MRVLLVANTLPPLDLSGAGEQVIQLAHGLRQAGHQVQILGRGPGGAAGPKILFPLTIVAPALRAVRMTHPDVVQVHESDGALVVLALALRRRRDFVLAALQQVSYGREFRAVRPVHSESGGRIVGRPVASELLFKWCRAPVQFIFGWLTARLVDLVLAPSRRTASELVADYGARNVAVVPNVTGAPLEGRVQRASRSGSSAASERSGRLLYVGRLRIRKGVEVLLESLALLKREKGIELSLDVVGDGERLGLLESHARRLGLERVRFKGRRNAVEIGQLLESALALVVPSTYEGMPLVILEAMDFECPVIASQVSGIPEVVREGENGWLVPPESAAALAAALESASREPLEAAARGAAGRRLLDQNYRPEQAARLWEQGVIPLLKRRRGEAETGGRDE